MQLVYADTKLPLKEHEKDGKIYVEVEPDAEYFVAIRRIQCEGPEKVLSKISIDGKSLGYQGTHFGVDREIRYHGIFSRIDGHSAQTALKFAKPQMTSGDEGYRGGMGNAEISIYEAVFAGVKQISNFSSSFTSWEGGAASATACKKKFLLSTAGSTVLAKSEPKSRSSSGSVPAMTNTYSSGRKIDTITLNYCSAVGLMEVGVLPKPEYWAFARMKRPAPAGQTGAQGKKIKDPVDGSKEVELFELDADVKEETTPVQDVSTAQGTANSDVPVKSEAP